MMFLMINIYKQQLKDLLEYLKLYTNIQDK